VNELLIIGFTEKHRALEVLPQLQRLHFDWTGDLQNAVAVEVERDGGLKLFLGLSLDSETSTECTARWRSILGAILPPHYWSYQAPGIVPEGNGRPPQPSLDQEFIRDAAALLQPGNSMLLALVRDGKAMLPVVSGYSRFPLHTRLQWL
jgi:uncharacterized membrane protein